MTEICDYFEVWFAHAAELVDPASGETVRFETLIHEAIVSGFAGKHVVLGFALKTLTALQPSQFLRFLAEGGHVRSLENRSQDRRLDEGRGGRRFDLRGRDRLMTDKRTKSRLAAKCLVHTRRTWTGPG